jgi:hypothetical protein
VVLRDGEKRRRGGLTDRRGGTKEVVAAGSRPRVRAPAWAAVAGVRRGSGRRASMAW